MRRTPLGTGLAVVMLTALAAAQVETSRRPQRVVGRVVAAGQPVAGAEVVIRWLQHPELPGGLVALVTDDASAVARITTGADGLFAVAVPIDGPFAVHATVADGRCSTRHFPVMVRDFVELALESASIAEGIVVDTKGQSVAGAHVMLDTTSGLGSHRDRYRNPVVPEPVVSDAEGHFRLPIVEADPDCHFATQRRIRASFGGMWSSKSTYRVDRMLLTALRIQLDATLGAAGTIVDERGTGIAGASIGDLVGVGSFTTTDADGKFTLPDTLESALFARAPGLRATTIIGRQVEDPIVLRPGATLTCTVVDAPEGARVVVETTTDGEPSVMAAWTTSVGDGGSLVVDNLTPGHWVAAYVEVDGRFLPLFCGVARATPQALGSVVVDAGRSLAGRVLDAHGAPKAGARVMLQPVLSDADRAARDATVDTPLPYRVTYTNRAGRFEFTAIGAGELRLGVDGGLDGLTVMRIAASEPQADLDIRLGNGLVRSGHVVDPNGSPARFARVQFVMTFAGPTVGEAAEFGMTYLYGRTDAAGAFTFRGLPEHMRATVWGVQRGEAGEAWMGSTSLTGNATQEIVVELSGRSREN